MKQLHVSTRSQWRKWLDEHHDQEPNGVWLVLDKKATGKPSLAYEDALEEALCFGWIDSAKKPETRAKRLKESLALLASGQKLGLK